MPVSKQHPLIKEVMIFGGTALYGEMKPFWKKMSAGDEYKTLVLAVNSMTLLSETAHEKSYITQPLRLITQQRYFSQAFSAK